MKRRQNERLKKIEGANRGSLALLGERCKAKLQEEEEEETRMEMRAELKDVS